MWDICLHSVHIISAFESLIYFLTLLKFCLPIITQVQYTFKLALKISDFESKYLNSNSICLSSFSFHVTQRRTNNMGFEVLMMTNTH